MSNPEISVLIPVYNTEKWISRCLESILNQSFDDFELVVVNDATPDDAMSLVNAYAKKDSRIKVINKISNEGLMAARRTAYQNARGKYYVFCDSDDYLPQNALKLLHCAITKNMCDIVFGGYTYVSGSGKEHVHLRGLKCKSPSDIHKSILMREMSWSLWGNIYNHELFIGYSYESFNDLTNLEDRILIIQLLTYATKIAAIPFSVYYYCQNSESSSQTRVSDNKFSRLLFAHNWCYNYLLNNCEFADLAKRDYLWVMTYLIELGYDKKKIVYYNQQTERLFTFGMKKKYRGVGFAIHSTLLYKYNFYRDCCSMGRKIIRYFKR